jgi:bacterioferritin-associated ferredoxin
MSKRLVCICNMVTEKEIQSMFIKGARSTADIQRTTRAGTSCGRCLVLIDALVEEYQANLPNDPQQKLNFDDLD